MHLRVPCFGLLQDWDARVGVLPESEEILVSNAGLGVVLQGIGAGKAEAGQRPSG